MINTSIFDEIKANLDSEAEEASAEVAAENVLRQQQMEKAGELQRVHYIGPSGLIPGYYSPNDRAFLPEFIVG